MKVGKRLGAIPAIELLSRLDGLSASSSVFTETRVGIEPEANSYENRGMSGYGMAACGLQNGRSHGVSIDARAWTKDQLRVTTILPNWPLFSR